MRILAIDPGPETSGFVIYDTDAHTVISAGSEYDNRALEAELTMCRVKLDCDQRAMFDGVVIEAVENYGRIIGQTTMDTLEWIGMFRRAWAGDLSLRTAHKVPRRDVKTYLCGGAHYRDEDTGALCKVTKATVKAAVIARHQATGGGATPQVGTKKEPGPLYGVKGHAWDALALAVTWAETREIARP